MAMHQAIAQLAQRFTVLLLEGLQSFPELTLTDAGETKTAGTRSAQLPVQQRPDGHEQSRRQDQQS